MITDTVLALDRYQFTADKRTCQANPQHGTLIPHASGTSLTCGRKGCEYAEPVGSDMLSAALALR